MFRRKPPNGTTIPSFWFKMLLLMMAIVFQLSVRRKIVRKSLPAASAKMIGAVSLLLWISTALSAKMMEYV